MENISLILGFFDGIHIGHRNVILSAVDYAKKKNAEAVLLTFKDSPAIYFGNKLDYIFSREKNYSLIKSLGVDRIIEYDFSELANISAEEFLEKYLIKIFNPISISTGFNYTFGAERQGTPAFLETNSSKYNYKYICNPASIVDSDVVSSTLIRDLLLKGNINKSNKLLCSNFSIKSKVIEGKKIGRKIGFPTANLIYPKNIVKIPYGIYCAKIGDKKAVLNWGIKPTIGGNEETFEVHILDFSGNLYGEILEVEILERLRGEQRFNNIEDLKLQIKKDIDECLKLL